MNFTSGSPSSVVGEVCIKVAQSGHTVFDLGGLVAYLQFLESSFVLTLSHSAGWKVFSLGRQRIQPRRALGSIVVAKTVMPQGKASGPAASTTFGVTQPLRNRQSPTRPPKKARLHITVSARRAHRALVAVG